MTRTLIVGCGYLGLRVACLLRERDEHVLGTTRSDQRAAALARFGVEPIRLELQESESALRLPAADRAVLCVSHDRRSGASRREVGVVGLERVARRLAEIGVRRVIHTGSISVYGSTAGGWVDEDSPTRPETESGLVQLEIESALRSAHPKLVILRLGGLYGPGRIIHRAAIVSGQPWRGDPERWLNLVHVDDAARAVVAALDAETPPPLVNVCDDRPLRRRECIAATAGCLGVEPPPWLPGDDLAEPDRRVRNTRLRALLLPELLYPTFDQGLPAALAAEAHAPGAGSM